MPPPTIDKACNLHPLGSLIRRTGEPGNQSRTIFSGLIKVEPGAHRTDAYQKVRNLLLSDDAEANSMRGLEILADDVRCTHGATSGQIEPEELTSGLPRWQESCRVC